MIRTKDRLGKELIDTHEKIVKNYIKKAKSYILKQHKAEEITPTLLKYMPNIIVEEPQELIEKVSKIIDQYKQLYQV